ncbi:Coiled-coil domain-containing protein [Trichinella spiralis]|uniref:Coiled-coil domain-containing protein n=1 Tax=Trichinella spiralis TaxID=6334 RepID=A0ABR3KCA8_TRISP
MFAYMLLFCSIATMMYSEQIAPQNIHNKFSDSLDLRTKIENVIQDLMISKQLKTFKKISNAKNDGNVKNENKEYNQDLFYYILKVIKSKKMARRRTSWQPLKRDLSNIQRQIFKKY